LSLYAEAEAKEGRTLPSPRLLSALRVDPEAAGDLRDHMVALVALHPATARGMNIGRVFHQKFGNGNVAAIDGNKLTIQFDKAGEKRVVDSFVERV